MAEDRCLKPEHWDVSFPVIKEELKDELLEDVDPLSSSSPVYDTFVKYECKEEVKHEITIEEHTIASDDADATGKAKLVQNLYGYEEKNVGRQASVSVSMEESYNLLHDSNDSEVGQIFTDTTLQPQSNCIIYPGKITNNDNNTRNLLRTGSSPCMRATPEDTLVSTSTLSEHTSTDIVEEHFSCVVCYAKFKYKGNLVKHMCRHAQEKLFPCTVCPAKFATSYNLKRHTRTHTGEKPFSCTVCSAKFAASADLKRHSSTHAEDEPFSCSVCFAKFTTKARLKFHVRFMREKKLSR